MSDFLELSKAELAEYAKSTLGVIVPKKWTREQILEALSSHAHAVQHPVTPEPNGQAGSPRG